MNPLQFELAHPDDLEEQLQRAPVAYVPLGTYEHHGWHLPVGFDGIKAHALCLKTAGRTGGVVLPTFYYGIGGGHVGYQWTAILGEPEVRPLLEATVEHLIRFGFRVVVLYTGHYAGEQVEMVRELAKEAATRHPEARFLGLTDPDLTTPLPEDRSPGDHAAKYETSIAMALCPEWVRLDRLRPGRETARVTLTTTPRSDRQPFDPTHPLYAIWGEDPRVTATAELGRSLVTEITRRLAQEVERSLAEVAR